MRPEEDTRLEEVREGQGAGKAQGNPQGTLKQRLTQGEGLGT